MTEFEMQAQIDALKKELADLKGQRIDGMVAETTTEIIHEYGLPEEYELYLDSACRHADISTTDTKKEVKEKIMCELNRLCDRYHVERPMTHIERAQAWINNKKQEEQRNAQRLERLKPLLK